MDLKALLAKHSGGDEKSSPSSSSGEHDTGGSLGPLAKKLGVSEELLSESLEAWMRDRDEGHDEPDDDDYKGPKSLKSLLS